jgi:pentatricopeptide repeat protein
MPTKSQSVSKQMHVGMRNSRIRLRAGSLPRSISLAPDRSSAMLSITNFSTTFDSTKSNWRLLIYSWSNARFQMRNFATIIKDEYPPTARAFLNALQTYRHEQSDPLTSQALKVALTCCKSRPQLALHILEQALAVQQQHTLNFVDLSHVRIVVLHLCRKNIPSIQLAENLLTEASKHFSMDARVYGTVMNGYAQSKTPEAFQRIQVMLTYMEENAIDILETQHYSIFMKAYLTQSPKDGVEVLRVVINNMIQLANAHKTERVLPSIVCYNTFLKAHLQERRPPNEMESVLKFLVSQFPDDANHLMYSYSMVIDAWGKSRAPDAVVKAKRIFDSIKHPKTTFVYNTMMNVYAERGCHEPALQLLNEMKGQTCGGCPPDDRTYSILLNAYQKVDTHFSIASAERALDAIQEPTIYHYNTMLNIYARQKCLDDAMELLGRVHFLNKLELSKANNSIQSATSYSIVLNALLRSDESVEKAEKVFQMIPLPSTIAYNQMLSIYAKFGLVDKARALHSLMKFAYESKRNATCQPDKHTHTSLLRAVANSNADDVVEQAERVFQSMTEHDTFTYNILLHVYATHGLLRKALSLVRRMQAAASCRPDRATQTTLRKAIKKAKDDDSEAKKQAYELLSSLPQIADERRRRIAAR